MGINVIIISDGQLSLKYNVGVKGINICLRLWCEQYKHPRKCIT